jgi:hypothetical protein
LTIQSILDGFEHVFMLPATNAAIGAGCAAFLDRALWARGTPIAVKRSPGFDATVAPDQTLARRTDVFVMVRKVAKVFARKVALLWVI